MPWEGCSPSPRPPPHVMPHSHFVGATRIDFQFVSPWLRIITYKAKRESLVGVAGLSFLRGCRRRGACIPSTNGVLIKNHLKVNIFLLNCAQTWLMKMGVWPTMSMCVCVCVCLTVRNTATNRTWIRLPFRNLWRGTLPASGTFFFFSFVETFQLLQICSSNFLRRSMSDKSVPNCCSLKPSMETPLF